MVHPSGAYQSISFSGSIQASKTTSIEALNRCVIKSSLSDDFIVVAFCFRQKFIQFIEALIPKFTGCIDPINYFI